MRMVLAAVVCLFGLGQSEAQQCVNGVCRLQSTNVSIHAGYRQAVHVARSVPTCASPQVIYVRVKAWVSCGDEKPKQIEVLVPKQYKEATFVAKP